LLQVKIDAFNSPELLHLIWLTFIWCYISLPQAMDKQI